jgi:LPXTG-site transpeptidase (sortase) family protein
MVKIGSKERFIVIVVVGLVLAIATGIVIYFNLAHKEQSASNEDVRNEDEEYNIVTDSVKIPSETQPTEFYVPHDLPKYITIPSIGIRGYIQSVGIDKQGLIAVPTNVHIAGWYINSAKPGQKGLSIIDGHRDGATIGGIFRNLEKLKKGEKITVEYGDGSLREFEVVDLKRLSIENAYDFMYSRIKEVDVQMNLVTCGGRWSKEIGTYEDRIIVRAKGI